MAQIGHPFLETELAVFFKSEHIGRVCRWVRPATRLHILHPPLLLPPDKAVPKPFILTKRNNNKKAHSKYLKPLFVIN